MELQDALAGPDNLFFFFFFFFFNQGTSESRLHGIQLLTLILVDMRSIGLNYQQPIQPRLTEFVPVAMLSANSQVRTVDLL